MPALDMLRFSYPVRHIALAGDGWAIVFPPTNAKLNRAVQKAFPLARYVERRIADTNAYYWWHVPPEDGLEARLSAFAETETFEWTPKAREELERSQAHAVASQALAGRTTPTKDVTVPDMLVPLRPYQQAALEYGMDKDRVYCADTAGCGKTPVGMAWIHVNDAYPCMMVVPANARSQAVLEYKHFFGDAIKVRVIQGEPGLGEQEEVRMWVSGPGKRALIIAWNSLHGWTPTIETLPLKGVILDEAHYARKWSSQRAKAAHRATKNVKKRIALSGTPAERGGTDLSSQLSILGVREQFAGYRALDVEKPTKADALALNVQLARVLMVRRRKEDVLDQLPELDEAWEAVDLEAARLLQYQRSERSIYEKTKGTGDFKIPMGTLRRMVGEAKVEPVLEVMEPYWSTPAVPILFCYHHAVMDALGEALEGRGLHTVRYDGRMSPAQKDEALKRFQGGHGRVLVAQMGAAGVALNLQRADTVFFAEIDYLSTTMEQAVARSHRSGNLAPRVTVRKLFAPNTLDDDIKAVAEERQKMIGVLVDGEQGHRAVFSRFRARMEKGAE